MHFSVAEMPTDSRRMGGCTKAQPYKLLNFNQVKLLNRCVELCLLVKRCYNIAPVGSQLTS